MNTLVVATWVQAIAAVLATVFAGGLGWIALQQLREALKTRQDSQRPLMVPSGPIMANSYQGYDPNAQSVTLKMKNAGPGLAFNVRAALFPPGADPARPQDHNPNKHTVGVSLPWESGKEEGLIFGSGGLDVWSTDQIAAQTLAPPFQAKPPGQDSFPQKARLTITYTDVFSRKHATMVDWNAGGPWTSVISDEVVKEDLMDLENRNIAARPKAQG